MNKKLIAKAVRIAKVILPPNGKITYKTVRTKDTSFYARIGFSKVDSNHIEYNENVLDDYVKRNKLTSLQQLKFLVQVTLHEINHTLTHNIIKHKQTDEMLCEIVERVFIGTIENLNLFELNEEDV